jgi:hypothetical protein
MSLTAVMKTLAVVSFPERMATFSAEPLHSGSPPENPITLRLRSLPVGMPVIVGASEPERSRLLL